MFIIFSLLLDNKLFEDENHGQREEEMKTMQTFKFTEDSV